MPNEHRTLKIEPAGDRWNGGITPPIRLTGRRLERAGFKPSHRVEVRFDEPGSLRLVFLSQTGLDTNESAGQSCLPDEPP